MKQAIETRELFVLDTPGPIVLGTHHKARNNNSLAERNLIDQDRVGLVFLNSLSPTRAGQGDSSVYWADSFAKDGYPAFRIDLPGFGDSNEDPPSELIAFINSGGYASIISAKIQALIVRFNLSGVILVGLCAGAVSAIYTAAISRECRGLVLLDPYFNLPLTSKSKVWGKIAGNVPPGALRRLIRGTLNHVRRLRVLPIGDQLPQNSNFTLLNRWKELASSGLPILVFNGPTISHRGGKFDYGSYILRLAGRKNHVAVKTISAANHTFANQPGRVAVRQHTEYWLNTYFPLMNRGEDADSSLCSESAGNKRQNKLQQSRLHA